MAGQYRNLEDLGLRSWDGSDQELDEDDIVTDEDDDDDDDNDDVVPQHVMISYSWSQQDIAVNLRDSLQKFGVKVWLDIDRMQGTKKLYETLMDGAIL